MLAPSEELQAPREVVAQFWRGKVRADEAATRLMRYYKATARLYDGMHVVSGDEHHVALNYISSFMRILGIRSVLDVGCGTGRGVKYFIENHPDVTVRGMDLSEDLLRVAVEKNYIPANHLVRGNANSLPFYDGAFDAVVALGLLHHVRYPNSVVRDMLRVAKSAIFISDSNRFAYGSLLRKLARVALHKLGMWPMVSYLKTGGRGYAWSESDGVSFSYSVFDSFPVMMSASERVVAIPTEGEGDLSSLPVFTAPHLLVCAVKCSRGKSA